MTTPQDEPVAPPEDKRPKAPDAPMEPLPEPEPVAETGPAWTPAQIASYNERHGAFPPGGAVGFEERRANGRARLRELRVKGVSKMTPLEKDEALQLLLDRQ